MSQHVNSLSPGYPGNAIHSPGSEGYSAAYGNGYVPRAHFEPSSNSLSSWDGVNVNFGATSLYGGTFNPAETDYHVRSAGSMSTHPTSPEAMVPAALKGVYQFDGFCNDDDAQGNSFSETSWISGSPSSSCGSPAVEPLSFIQISKAMPHGYYDPLNANPPQRIMRSSSRHHIPVMNPDTSSSWPTRDSTSCGPFRMYPELPGYSPLSQHAPVPSHSRSTYSELAANIPFITQAAATPAYPQGRLTEPQFVTQDRLRWPIGRASPKSKNTCPPSPQACGNSVAALQKIHQSVSEDFIVVPPRLSTIRKNADKKQSLACLFCRERKIACGRPPEGSKDPTCNQCARRSFKCEYPKESRRGQHKRLPRHQACPGPGTAAK